MCRVFILSLEHIMIKVGHIITIDSAISTGTAKLISNNIVNTLHWLITTNKATIEDLFDKVKAEVDGGQEDTPNQRRMSWISDELDLQLAAFDEAKYTYSEKFGEVWQPRGTAKIETKRASVKELLAKHAPPARPRRKQ